MKRQFLKGASALLLCAMLLGVAAGQETSAAGTSTTGTSTWVFFGDNHRLQYHQDANGNRIMDFSFAGYQGGKIHDAIDVSILMILKPVIVSEEYPGFSIIRMPTAIASWIFPSPVTKVAALEKSMMRLPLAS